MSTYTVLILIIISSFAASELYRRNVNSFEGPLDFSCPHDQTLRLIESINSNDHEDRMWSFGCTDASAAITDCYWSGYVNSYAGRLEFRCNGDGFINGMKSTHSPYYEDRRWAYQCCTLTGHRTSNCYNTGDLNNYDGTLAYIVPCNKLIHGASSVHNNYYGDRRFGFQICDYEPMQKI